MSERVRPYLFYDTAISICSTCFRRAEGKIVFEGGNVYLLKRCPVHGPERVLMADDIDYYRRCREIFLKTPEMPARYNMPVRWDCPYDCGLCLKSGAADVLSRSSKSPTTATSNAPFATPPAVHRAPAIVLSIRSNACSTPLSAMKAAPTSSRSRVANKPLHPQFFEILDMARQRPIQHLMVNTNGIRIAREDGFAERLAEYMPGFEIYLQFDSFEPAALKELRGADLTSIRMQAIEKLNRLGVSTSLVVTLKRGLNDGEIGRIVDWAVEQPCVRGVVFWLDPDADDADVDPATIVTSADRSPATPPRPDQPFPSGGRDPRPVPSRFARDGVRAQVRRQGDSAHRRDRPANPDRWRPQHANLWKRQHPA